VDELTREAFGVRGACSRFQTTPALRQRQQAGRTPNASRSSVAAFCRAVLIAVFRLNSSLLKKLSPSGLYGISFPPVSMTAAEFKKKWARYQGKETSAYQAHFDDLCRLLGQPPSTR
jgi:hypothetical protein